MKSGRPRHADIPETAAADELIARTCHQLIVWGYPRLKTFAVVAREAQAAIPLEAMLSGPGLKGRQKHVKADRVKKIYEQWRASQNRRDLTMQRWRYAKDWLIGMRHIGDVTIEQAARHLLLKKRFPRLKERITDPWGEREVEVSEYMLHGDPWLTPRGTAEERRQFGRLLGEKNGQQRELESLSHRLDQVWWGLALKVFRAKNRVQK